MHHTKARTYARMHAHLPGVEVHGSEPARVGGLHKEVERLRLVNEGAAVGGHVDQHALLDLPRGLVQEAKVGRDLGDALHRPARHRRHYMATYDASDMLCLCERYVCPQIIWGIHLSLYFDTGAPALNSLYTC